MLSAASPPALRITWASPREIPNALAGSRRASWHVTDTGQSRSCSFERGGSTDGITFAGGKGEFALFLCVRLDVHVVCVGERFLRED